MPHCIIEITKNLLLRCDNDKLMNDVAIALNETGCFKSNDIKIRIYSINLSCMGIERNKEHSYVATDIQVLNNKSEDQLLNIRNSVHNIITTYFKESIGINSITTRVSLIDNNLYSRTTNYDL